MAQLPPDGTILVQLVSPGKVAIFNRNTEEELVTFDPRNQDEVAKAQRLIYDNPDMDDEQKCFAHFWAGYFYAHACWDAPCPHCDELDEAADFGGPVSHSHFDTVEEDNGDR